MDEQDSAGTLPQWEHHIEYIIADAHNAQTKDFLATRYRGEKMPRYAVQASILRLDTIGAQGWELVHMEPVWVQNDGSVSSATGVGTNTYLCVFKRLARRG